jgi:hypothetical protein
MKNVSHDTILNMTLLATGMLSLFLAVLDAPVRAAPPVTAGVVASADLA